MLATELPINTLGRTLVLVFVGSATRGASAGTGMMGSTQVCVNFVLSTPVGFL